MSDKLISMFEGEYEDRMTNQYLLGICVQAESVAIRHLRISGDRYALGQDQEAAWFRKWPGRLRKRPENIAQNLSNPKKPSFINMVQTDMDTVKTLTLIETTLGRRGTGKDNDSPIRVITQYWTPEGKLVTEIDPSAMPLTPEGMAAMREVLLEQSGNQKQAEKLWEIMLAAGMETVK